MPDLWWIFFSERHVPSPKGYDIIGLELKC
jgi:hypothetical protein